METNFSTHQTSLCHHHHLPLAQFVILSPSHRPCGPLFSRPNTYRAHCNQNKRGIFDLFMRWLFSHIETPTLWPPHLSKFGRTHMHIVILGKRRQLLPLNEGVNYYLFQAWQSQCQHEVSISIMNNLVCGRDINSIIEFGSKTKPSVESKKRSPRWYFISVTYLIIVLFTFQHLQYLRYRWTGFGKAGMSDASDHSGVAFPKLY